MGGGLWSSRTDDDGGSRWQCRRATNNNVMECACVALVGIGAGGVAGDGAAIEQCRVAAACVDW